jgi:hypothetical protein
VEIYQNIAPEAGEKVAEPKAKKEVQDPKIMAFKAVDAGSSEAIKADEEGLKFDMNIRNW